MSMAKPREAWEIRPATKRTPLTASVKADVESKARDLIENALKPKHVLPHNDDLQFNYITDIGAKWYRNYFCFFSIYACPHPNASMPSFESKFARMEALPDEKYALYSLRHTGKEWVGVFDGLSVDECMNAIKDNEWFMP